MSPLWKRTTEERRHGEHKVGGERKKGVGTLTRVTPQAIQPRGQSRVQRRVENRGHRSDYAFSAAVGVTGTQVVAHSAAFAGAGSPPFDWCGGCDRVYRSGSKPHWCLLGTSSESASPLKCTRRATRGSHRTLRTGSLQKVRPSLTLPMLYAAGRHTDGVSRGVAGVKCSVLCGGENDESTKQAYPRKRPEYYSNV